MEYREGKPGKWLGAQAGKWEGEGVSRGRFLGT